MPEYLAPGVYVEETSFRSKSIEGVGTSTTGFVGPTRKGPVGGSPELLTSVGDFERIYGGPGDLDLPATVAAELRRNFLAHAVRHFFDNGGARLYVSRVFVPRGDSDPGRAASPFLLGDANAAVSVRVLSRTPGSTGNGRVTFTQVAAPATARVMGAAQAGTLLRVGGKAPVAKAGTIGGGVPPFSVNDKEALQLVVGGTAVTATFRGAPAEVTAAAPLGDTVAVDPANGFLSVTIGGLAQKVTIPTGPAVKGPDILAAINQGLRGGYARVTNDGRLVIGSDARGTSSKVHVDANPSLQFNAPGDADPDPASNVADLLHVTADEINKILVKEGDHARAGVGPDGKLVLRTFATGAAATIKEQGTADPVLAALGVTKAATGAGQDGTLKYYVKTANGADGSWAQADNPATTFDPKTLKPADTAEFLTLTASAVDGDGQSSLFEDLALDPRHPRYISHVLAQKPSRRIDDLETTFAVDVKGAVNAAQLHDALVGDAGALTQTLSGGNDGGEPASPSYQDALDPLVGLEDLSILAAPGSTAYTDFQAIQGAIVAHVERPRAYRIAVLDTQPSLEPTQARDARGLIDSTRAALYYPWVVVSNPLARPGRDDIPREITVPPSGFVCGVYARSDVQRGVFKAPANEVVLGAALRFQKEVNFAQQGLLNPIGVNCLRTLSGRGLRVWGARTASSDPEWKYVNVRRYFLYLEASIDRGTQWSVFEPNGPRLWSNVRDTISGFLYNEWFSGSLLGDSPKEAYFVRCDRSTMTQNDLDNGRLICLIGVAVIKPAEFVIFRIGQMTTDSRG